MTYTLNSFMHTENDTFNKLRRQPFEYVRMAVRELNRTGKGKKAAKLLKNAGWTVKEYNHALILTY